MMTREPCWRMADEKDWGFSRVSWKDSFKAVFSVFGQVKDPITNHFQKRRLAKTLKHVENCCISIGSGADTPKGWIGFDRYRSGQNVFPVNLMYRFPLNDSSVHAILAEHIIEHFFFDDIFRLLEECSRVLVPSGKLRIVCPDAQKIAKLILEGKNAENNYDVIEDSKIHRWPHDGLLWARTVNRLSHQWGQHKSLLTAEMIKQILEKIGFEKIYILNVKESVLFESPPDIHHKRFPDDSSDMSFAVEAMAPMKGRR